MEIVFLLVLVSLIFIGLLAGALYWAIKTGQFDDMQGHGHQILMDDDKEVNKDEMENN
jgi:cbb3-type cytochrome oxidase maturation protein